MIRQCELRDVETIITIVNDAAQAYKGIIPTDCWKEPYMTEEELLHEIDEGVTFWGYEDDGNLLGVMGLQYFEDAALIRHAYVRTTRRNLGIGSTLLSFLKAQTNKPILIGTWAAAEWAIRFYQKHGYGVVSTEEKDVLLKKYWNIPERQVETSVVLVDVLPGTGGNYQVSAKE